MNLQENRDRPVRGTAENVRCQRTPSVCPAEIIKAEHQLPADFPFTLNIVGPIKVSSTCSPYLRGGTFRMIRTQCMAWKLPDHRRKRIEDITGYEGFPRHRF